MRVAVIDRDMIDVRVDGRSVALIDGQPERILTAEGMNLIIIHVKSTSGYRASIMVDAIQKGE